MSWGIEFDAYLPCVRRCDIGDSIVECREILRFYENRLLTLSSVNTQLFPTEHEDVPRYEFLATEIPNIVEGITEEAGRLALLQQALDAEGVKDV